MEFRDYITPEMQKKWFKGINDIHNYYFIIKYEGKEVGLTNVRDIDYEKMQGEGGIFIYNDDYRNTDLVFRVTLCQNDYFFEKMKFKRFIGRILKTNKKAIRYNKVFGAVLLPNQENTENQFWTMSCEDYYINRKKIIKMIK